MAHAPEEPDYSVSADSEEIAEVEADLGRFRGKLRTFPKILRILDIITDWRSYWLVQDPNE